MLISFGAWWEGLSAFTQIYWMIAIPASFILLFQFAHSLLAPKPETIQLNSTQNPALESNADITFQLISFKNFIGFFTALGWSGLACIDSGLAAIPTLLTSFICGAIIMLTMAIFFYFMSKLMKTVEEDM